MRWSVGVEAEGDRVLTREEVVELADAVAASNGIATGIGTSRYGAQLVVEAGSREEAIEKATAEFAPGRGAGPACRRGPVVRAEAISEDEDDEPDDPARLAGRVPVRGPAACWPAGPPPPVAAVYAILCKPDPETKPERYAVIYVGHADDLSAERFPFRHPRAPCWVRRAGSRWKVYIATYEVPGGTRRTGSRSAAS